MGVSTNLTDKELSEILEVLNGASIRFTKCLANAQQHSFYFDYSGNSYFAHYFNGELDVLNKFEIAQEKSVENKKEVVKEDKKTLIDDGILFADVITLYADGSCIGNPGPAGSGISVYYDDVYQYCFYGNYVEMGTNNVAELNALKHSMLLARDYLENGAREVVVKMDSKYSISCVTEWLAGWVKNNWKTSAGKLVKNKEIIQEIYEVYSKIKNNVKIEYVPGHQGIEGNELADRVANLAVSNKKDVMVKCNLTIQEILDK